MRARVAQGLILSCGKRNVWAGALTTRACPQANFWGPLMSYFVLMLCPLSNRFWYVVFLSAIHNKEILRTFIKSYSFFSATKQEKLLQKRYAEFLKYPAVTKTLTLPLLVPSVHGQSKSELSFSVADGMKWKVCKRRKRFLTNTFFIEEYKKINK